MPILRIEKSKLEVVYYDPRAKREVRQIRDTKLFIIKCDNEKCKKVFERKQIKKYRKQERYYCCPSCHHNSEQNKKMLPKKFREYYDGLSQEEKEDVNRVNIESHNTPEYREKISQIVKGVWANRTEEEVEEIGNKISVTMVENWENKTEEEKQKWVEWGKKHSREYWDSFDENNPAPPSWIAGLTKETDERVALIAEKISGENNYGWKGGVRKLLTEVRNHKNFHKLWRLPIFMRDNFKCMKCGSKEELHVHHNKEPMAKILHKLKDKFSGYDPENLSHKKLLAKQIVEHHINNNISGITLCKKCHMRLHSKKGLEGFNDPNQK